VTDLRTLLVIAKQPLAGRVKTRLAPPLTFEQAADVAGAALWDTLRAVARVPAGQRVLAFDGDATSWCPEGWRVSAQPGGGLDARLVAAFTAAGDGPAVLVGMDTPQLRAEQLMAWDRDRFDACLGPASDGGYWAIGFTDPTVAAAAIAGIPMSLGTTREHQLTRLDELGLRVQILDELTDVDTIDTAREVASEAPHSAFAHALTRTGLR
jgi:uncharacterized protein